MSIIDIPVNTDLIYTMLDTFQMNFTYPFLIDSTPLIEEINVDKKFHAK